MCHAEALSLFHLFSFCLFCICSLCVPVWTFNVFGRTQSELPEWVPAVQWVGENVCLWGGQQLLFRIWHWFWWWQKQWWVHASKMVSVRFLSVCVLVSDFWLLLILLFLFVTVLSTLWTHSFPNDPNNSKNKTNKQISFCFVLKLYQILVHCVSRVQFSSVWLNVDFAGVVSTVCIGVGMSWG